MSTAVHAGQQTATIELVDATGHAVTTWSITDVVAVHWSVAAAVSGKMAVETLELAHGASCVRRALIARRPPSPSPSRLPDQLVRDSRRAVTWARTGEGPSGT
jgi:hypothetical protein